MAVTGNFKGAVDFGGGVLASAGDYDIFVVRFCHNGTYAMSKRFGDAASQFAEGIAINSSGLGYGYSIITGSFNGAVDFGGGALTSAGGDIFVADLAANGFHIWSKRFGDGEYQYAKDVAVDALGNVIVVGGFHGSVNFGSGVVTSAGSDDIFIAKFKP